MEDTGAEKDVIGISGQETCDSGVGHGFRGEVPQGQRQYLAVH